MKPYIKGAGLLATVFAPQVFLSAQDRETKVRSDRKALAKNAGLRKNDVIIAVDGKTNYGSESELMATIVNSKQPGDSLEVTALRDGKRMTFNFAAQ